MERADLIAKLEAAGQVYIAERMLDLALAGLAVLDGEFVREDTEYADALFAGLEQALVAAVPAIPRGLCRCQPYGDGFHVCGLCRARERIAALRARGEG